MSERKAKAVWNGDLKSGDGKMQFGSSPNEFKGDFTFKSRFEEGTGTNPEELLGAAHAGCYSMAFSNELAQAGHTPESVETDAEVTLKKEGITQIHLNTTASVPGIEENEFMQIARSAKENCPVSKALQAVDIKLDASLNS